MEQVKTGGLEIHLLPGDHLSYIREHAPAVAAKLRELIERTTSPPSHVDRDRKTGNRATPPPQSAPEKSTSGVRS